MEHKKLIDFDSTVLVWPRIWCQELSQVLKQAI
jgi:hypothetical protein